MVKSGLQLNKAWAGIKLLSTGVEVTAYIAKLRRISSTVPWYFCKYFHTAMPNCDTFPLHKQNRCKLPHMKEFELPKTIFFHGREKHKRLPFNNNFRPWEDIVRKKVLKSRSIA